MESTLLEKTDHSGSAKNNDIKKTVYPNDLIQALSQRLTTTRILSLDCFDTLIWRNTATPQDVFYHLQNKQHFRALGLTTTLRVRLEAQARRIKLIEKWSTEVNLEDIYQTGYPQLTHEELNHLAEEELAAEMECCFAFQPVVELIRFAKQHDLKVMIISNTYFKTTELKRLLAHCLPEEIMKMIDHVICSSEHDRSKNDGLFNIVCKHLRLNPQEILHIGDNEAADFHAPMIAGMQALHLYQYDPAINELLRYQTAAALLFNQEIRNNQPLLSPFRPLFANIDGLQPEQLIGYASLGPIMYAFAKYILNEVNVLNQAGQQTKILFLMRDAYLPFLACEALVGHPIGHCVRISRFSSYAASFNSKKEIDKYLAENAMNNRFEELCKQLLLPEKVSTPLLKVIKKSNCPTAELIKQLQRPDIQKIIIKKSTEYRERLINYLKKEIDLQEGDTLMFIDLGYFGTAQRQLENILHDTINVKIIGRYLIQLDVPQWRESRAGLIDPSWCDERIMMGIVNYIALLEQVSTSNEKSIIGYEDDGEPIYSTVKFNEQQYLKVKKIQQECLRFIRDVKQYDTDDVKMSLPLLRSTALNELGRLIFLPTENEVKYFQSFEFDVNLGTNDILHLFDAEKGLASLRKRGFFFQFMEKNQKTARTNYPIELKSAGLELAMTFITHARFGFPLVLQDMSLRREKLIVLLTNSQESCQSVVEATLTYDGYYSLIIPAGKNGCYTGIMFGEKYHWIQFESVEIFRKETFLNNVESLYTEDYWSAATFIAMTEHGDHLYQCDETRGTMILAPIKEETPYQYLMRIVFRPVVKRQSLSSS